jgi:hypothetical protein
MADEELKKAGVLFAKCVASMVKNYVSFTISDSLIPVFKEAVMSILDDAKSSMSKEKKEVSFADSLPSESKGVDEPQMFTMECEDMDYKWRGSAWTYFATYPVTCVRVGKQKSDGKFFVLGKSYRVRYGILQRAVEKVRTELEDNKDTTTKKPGDLPPEPIWGTVCCCIEKHDSEAQASQAMASYMREFVKDHSKSKALANWFYLGDDYINQQKARAVFKKAYAATKVEVLNNNYFEEHLAPFNEAEAVTLLLQNVAKYYVTPELMKLVPSVPCCQWRLYWGMDTAVQQAIEVAMKAWDPVQDKINDVIKSIQKMVDEGADKLVGELKPLIEKILGVVQKAMGDDKNENKKEEKKSAAIGDVIVNWKFERTEIGQKFNSSLAKQSAKQSLNDVKSGLASAMESELKSRIEEGVKNAMGGGIASMEIVKLVCEKVAEQIAKVIRRFTSVEHLLRAGAEMAGPLEDLEKKLADTKSDSKAQVAAINSASGKMWDTLADAGLRMYKAYRGKHSEIRGDLSGVCEEGIQPLLDVVDNLFVSQMRVLNAVRVTFTDNLRAKAESGAVGADDVHQVFADAVFQYINALTTESWVSLAAALIASALAQVLDLFNTKIWPSILKPLEELQNMVPDPLAKAGLNIPPIALNICTMLITKAVTGILNKLIMSFEKSLWTQ